MKQEAKQMIANYVDSHREEMLSLWQEVVNMDSGSGYKAGIDAVALRFQQVLDGEGASTRIVEMENVRLPAQ